MGMGCVGSLIGIGVYGTGYEISFLVHVGDDMKFHRMTCPRAVESLFPSIFKFDWAATYTSGQKGVQRFSEGILFVSESSTDVGFDDPYVAESFSKRLGTYPPYDMGDLG